MPVDVRTVQSQRRKLRFDSYDELLAEARRLVELDSAASPLESSSGGAGASSGAGVRQLANLNLGQSLGHMALWIDSSIDGARMDPPPAALRLVARLMKGYILSHTVMAGFKLPAAADAHYVPPPSTTPAEGLAALTAAIGRLRRESKRAPSVLLGPLSTADWDRLHLRHAELHLSYLLPQ